MSAASCPECGARLEPQRVSVEATRGVAHGLAESAPVLTCPAGHDHREAVPGVPEAIAADLERSVLLSSRSRVPWRPERCGACAEPLTMPDRRTTRSVTVSPADGPPFTVTMDLPARRCTECAADNLPAAAWPDVRGAALATVGLG